MSGSSLHVCGAYSAFSVMSCWILFIARGWCTPFLCSVWLPMCGRCVGSDEVDVGVCDLVLFEVLLHGSISVVSVVLVYIVGVGGYECVVIYVYG